MAASAVMAASVVMAASAVFIAASVASSISTAIMGKALRVLIGPLKARRKYHLNSVTA